MTRSPSAAASCRARPTRRSTRTRRDRTSTPSPRRLYGLNWAKADIVTADQVIVCEGYTDVIGFHRGGVPARRGHVRHGAHRGPRRSCCKRFASRVVLAFDADAAGQGAAERFYEWEQKYQVQVSVASFPKGQDPGRAQSH